MASAQSAAGPTSITRTQATHAVIASFLGWTLDAFDFFILLLVLAALARDLTSPSP